MIIYTTVNLVLAHTPKTMNDPFTMQPMRSSNNILLSKPMQYLGGSHNVLPIVPSDWVMNSEYLFHSTYINFAKKRKETLTPSWAALVNHDCLSIPIKSRILPRSCQNTAPLYTITLTAIQRQPKPSPNLCVVEECEIWTEDESDALRRIVVGRCQGQEQGYFFFPCWGCKGVCDSAYDHHSCPYGILKVQHSILHPSFDTSTVPKTSVDHMNVTGRNVQPEHHLRLALVYPPGYASDIMMWYDYLAPGPVLFVGMDEMNHAEKKMAEGETSSGNAVWWRSRRAESKHDRNIAHLARDLAKSVAELCQAVYKERTYRRLLATNVRERDMNAGVFPDTTMYRFDASSTDSHFTCGS